MSYMEEGAWPAFKVALGPVIQQTSDCFAYGFVRVLVLSVLRCQFLERRAGLSSTRVQEVVANFAPHIIKQVGKASFRAVASRLS